MIVIDNNKKLINLQGQSSCQHTGATVQFVGTLFCVPYKIALTPKAW